MSVPNKMDIEIDESDILSSANSILNAMSGIREEFIQQRYNPQDGNIQQEEAVDEYMHLSYRLASVLKTFDTENIKEQLKTVKEAIEKTPALLDYDYLQDEFWKVRCSDFSRSLEKILITIRRENFSTLKDKHHVIQAVKYMLTENKVADKRLRIFDTIKPFSPNSTEHNKEFFERELRKLDINIAEKNTIVRTKNKSLEEAINLVSSLGFDRMQVLADLKEFEDTQKKYPSARIIQENQNLEGLVEGERDTKTRRVFRKVMPYLKPITYPILGNMPVYLQQKVQDYVGERGYNPVRASYVSVLTNFGAYILLLKLLGGYKDPRPNWVEAAIGLTLFGGCLGETFVRSFLISQEGGFGSLVGKILLFPLEVCLGISSFGRIENSRLVMEIDLARKNEKTDNTDYFATFNEFSKKRLKKESEENLVWSERHHNIFGRYFARDLLEDKKQALENCEQYFDRKNDLWNIYNKKLIDNYTNLTVLTCKKDERYTLSLVSQNKLEVQEINQIITKPISNEEKLKEIAQKYDAEFARLIRYENCIKKDDYEAV